MGDMADYFLSEVCEQESIRDDYCSGLIGVNEAYENGLIDELGFEEGMQDSWDRSFIPTLDNCNNELSHAEKNLIIATRNASGGDSARYFRFMGRHRRLNPNLSDFAILNLTKSAPTCNECSELMRMQSGKFGDFYFCIKQCKGQKTVSSKYWESVRIKSRE